MAGNRIHGADYDQVVQSRFAVAGDVDFPIDIIPVYRHHSRHCAVVTASSLAHLSAAKLVVLGS